MIPGQLLQIFAILLFVLCFFVPLLWCWGHALAIVLAIIGMHMESSAKQSARQLRRLEAAVRGEPPPRPSVAPLIVIVLGVIAGAAILIWLVIAAPDLVKAP